MGKNLPVQYLTDEAGNKQAVVVPFGEWQKILQALNELADLQALSKSLNTAFHEVEAIKQGKIARTTLSDFLNEC